MAQLTPRDVLVTLLRRCVECPPTQPGCPVCPSDETCSLIPQSCNACASTTCVKKSQFAGQITETKDSKPIGPIIGGVVAGILVFLIGVFCVWYFCLRTRRRKDTWAPPEKRDQSNLTRDPSRTQSVASTVFTRASNVIQIAYIPGVTGRSSSIPPVPSEFNTASNTPQPDTHFFMADDLRNSTWSDASADPRISLAPSLARASSATTVYYESAVVPPIPAQHAFRAQANVVSVKQGGSSGASTVSTPPVRASPVVPGAVKPVNINNSSIVARHVVARPIEVRKNGSTARVPTLGNLAKVNSPRSATAASNSEPVFEEKEVVLSPVTDIVDSPSSPPIALRSKPSDMSLGGESLTGVSPMLPADNGLGKQTSSPRPDSGGLTAMIEDAIKSASADSRKSPRPGNHRTDSGPFSDVHELPSSSP